MGKYTDDEIRNTAKITIKSQQTILAFHPIFLPWVCVITCCLLAMLFTTRTAIKRAGLTQLSQNG